MPWAGLDDSLLDDPRVVEVGWTAFGLYCAMTIWCARHLTDGKIPMRMVERLLENGDTAPLYALVKVELVKVAGKQVEVVDFLKGGANRTRAQVEAARAKGRKGAAARWPKNRAPF